MALYDGTSLNDRITGSPDADTMNGLGGNDILWGEGGGYAALPGSRLSRSSRFRNLPLALRGRGASISQM